MHKSFKLKFYFFHSIFSPLSFSLMMSNVMFYYGMILINCESIGYLERKLQAIIEFTVKFAECLISQSFKARPNYN